MNVENDTNQDFKILSEKPVELEKEEFFRMLIKNDSLDLTIKKVGKTHISKYKNDLGVNPSGFFIDYGFKLDETEYEIGIFYNVGIPVKEDVFKLTSGMNIFIISEIAIDLSKAKEIEISKKFIDEKLTGIRFKATYGTGYNGGFIIKPVKLID